MANLEDNYKALVLALARVVPLADESERSDEAADRGHSPFNSETLTLTTSFVEYNIKCFGITLDDSGGFGRYLEMTFNGPNDPDVMRLHVGQTAKWLRGTKSKVWIRASIAATYEVTWHLDRFTMKGY